MAFTPQCITWECITWAEFIENPSKFSVTPVVKIDDSKPALLLPLIDPKDSNYQFSAEYEAKYEIERERALVPLKIERKPEETPLDPAILKEMNELSDLLYGPD